MNYKKVFKRVQNVQGDTQSKNMIGISACETSTRKCGQADVGTAVFFFFLFLSFFFFFLKPTLRTQPPPKAYYNK